MKAVLKIACTMGNQQMLQFIEAIKQAMISPYVLQEMALTIAQHLSQEHPHQLAIQLTFGPLASLLREALSQFIKCIRLKTSVAWKNQKPGVVIELINGMRETARYVPNGEEELGSFIMSLACEVKNRKLKRLLTHNFPEYFPNYWSQPPKETAGQTTKSNHSSSPFRLVPAECWDD